jgi:hypothetical protein
MGADLYMKGFDEVYERNMPRLRAAAELRNHLRSIEDDSRADKCQRYVEYWHSAIYAGNRYFRDSYNDWNALNKCGISWWRDVIPMLDDEGNLTATTAQQLKAMIVANEAEFNAAIEGCSDKDKAYFTTKRTRLLEMLDTTIQTDGFIDCSL